jgi:hypothetical protein
MTSRLDAHEAIHKRILVVVIGVKNLFIFPISIAHATWTTIHNSTLASLLAYSMRRSAHHAISHLEVHLVFGHLFRK